MTLPIPVSIVLDELTKNTLTFSIKECLQQIAIDKIVFFSWGVSMRANYFDKALLLKVSGKYFKGWVAVTLAWDDTYTVSFIKQSGKVEKTTEGIYCDMLQEYVDGVVETKQKTKRKANC